MMVVTDLKLIETSDGGDCVLVANDLQMISGFQNMPYIGLFGGNIEQSTTGPKTTEQTFDFWGNYLLHPTLQEVWFNSKTEKLLMETALNSAGRMAIEQQVKKDVEFMQQFAAISVSVTLVAVDRINIAITIMEPNALNSNVFTYIWDATNAELTMLSNGNSNVYGLPLDNFLDMDL